MLCRGVKYLSIFIFILIGALCINAQTTDASTADGKPSKEDYPNSIKESFAKQRIKQQEKEFSEMVQRSEEVVKISDELWKSFETNQKLSTDDAKKTERLEKLARKIRQELGGENDGDKENTVAVNSSLSLADALQDIQKTSNNLSSEVKKVGRFSVSVAAIENSNTLLRMVRFIRLNQN